MKEQGGERERARQMAAIQKAMTAGGFKPASDVLTLVRSVPTVCVQVDHALRVGGWPLERIGGIHGPTHEGKTLFTLLLVLSFLMRGHFVLYLDAEQTTAIDWVAKLLGAWSSNERFCASRTTIYEDVTEEVRAFFEMVAQLRKDGIVSKDTSALVVVDSLKKLTPRSIFKKVIEGAGGYDGTDGRTGQIKAKYNTAWFDELPPLLTRTGGAIVFVLREMEDTQATSFEKAIGNDYKVGGGKSVQFEPSILARVTRASYLYEGSEEAKKAIGERHRVTIRKSKVAGKDGKVSVAYFHSSNGKLIPEGHDRVRDVIELAEAFGVVQKSGAWLSHGDERIACGINNVVKVLTANTEWLERIEVDVRKCFEEKKAQEHDEDGVIA